MSNQPKRVSQGDVADLLASAVSIEKQRIEQLGAEAVNEVSGGLLKMPDYFGDGPIMGAFPSDPIISF